MAPERKLTQDELLRQKILRDRKTVPSQEWKSLGKKGVQRILSSNFWHDLLTQQEVYIGLFAPLGDEPGVMNGEIRGMETKSIHFLYPRIRDQKACEMDFVEQPSESEEEFWKVGPFGVREPASNYPASEDRVLQKIQLIFVPGVAFGESGERWGRGAGYYDRFLPRVPKAVRVSLAFEFQVQEHLSQEHWDQAVDWIITEKREIQTPRFFEKWKKLINE